MVVQFVNFNPWVAAQQGADLAQGNTDAYRDTRRYNALREMYGDVVGRNDTAMQLAEMQRQNALQPGRLREQQLSNQTAQQNLSFNEQYNPLRLRKTQQEIDNSARQYEYDRQMDPLRVEEQRGVVENQQRTAEFNRQNDPLTLEQNRQKVETNRRTATEEQASRQRTLRTGLAAAAEEQLDAGKSPEEVFDTLAPQIADMEGESPEGMAAIRQQFLANPRRFIAATRQYMDAARPDAALIRARSQAELNTARKAESEAKRAKLTPETTQSQLVGLDNERAVGDRAEADLLRRGGALDRVSSSAGARYVHALTADLTKAGITLSHAENDYRANMKSLIASLGLDRMTTLKGRGATFGSVTEGEHALLQASATRLRDMTRKEDIRRELEAIREARRNYFDLLELELAVKAKVPGAQAALDKRAAEVQAQRERSREQRRQERDGGGGEGVPAAARRWGAGGGAMQEITGRRE